ncbi:hypothetical protein PIB30_052822 [Stylosanthes scabra]|uniref:Uncharacterized protein n=1 Tax=Stylosanthes scabra TaxID=79078 RepID=A0ABU6ZH54_9FABA|nr:hypothetical protein [Stylosanthes scabra]
MEAKKMKKSQDANPNTFAKSLARNGPNREITRTPLVNEYKRGTNTTLQSFSPHSELRLTHGSRLREALVTLFTSVIHANHGIGCGDERLNMRTAMDYAWMLDGAMGNCVYALSLASRVNRFVIAQGPKLSTLNRFVTHSNRLHPCGLKENCLSSNRVESGLYRIDSFLHSNRRILEMVSRIDSIWSRVDFVPMIS